MPISVNLRLAWRLKPQLHEQNPHRRVTKLLVRGLVRLRGLGLYSLRILFARA